MSLTLPIPAVPWPVLAFPETMEATNQEDSESTVTSFEDENTENFCENPTRDTLAEGLVGLFKPAIDVLEERVSATQESQAKLHAQLDTLLVEIKKIQETQKASVDLTDYVRKLINVKHKVTLVTNILQGTQDRLGKLHQQIDKEKLRRRTLLDSELPTSFPHLNLDSTSGSSTL